MTSAEQAVEDVLNSTASESIQLIGADKMYFFSHAQDQNFGPWNLRERLRGLFQQLEARSNLASVPKFRQFEDSGWFESSKSLFNGF